MCTQDGYTASTMPHDKGDALQLLHDHAVTRIVISSECYPH